MFWLLLWTLASFNVTRSHPIHLLNPATLTTEHARSLWGWIWAPDSVVSIIDRDIPLTFPSRPALFGAELKHNVVGYVIPLSSFTTPCHNDTSFVHDDQGNFGCPKLCSSGSAMPGPADTWIALVQRGNCSFAAKALEAQRWGAGAVVVGGEDPTWRGSPDNLISMMGPGDTSTDNLSIVATYIRHVDYVQLHHIIEQSDTVHSGLRTVTLAISPDTPAGGWVSPAITFVTILLLPSLLTFITLLIHRFRMVRAARRERAPEDIVRSLPWRVWTGQGWEKHEGVVPGQDQPVTTPAATAVAPMDAEEGILTNASSSLLPAHTVSLDDAEEPAWAKTQYECAICLSEFAVGDRVRVLPCAHIFHMDEVDGWLINNKKLCPVCKADVTQPPASSAEQGPDSGSGMESSESSPTERTPLLARAASADAGSTS